MSHTLSVFVVMRKIEEISALFFFLTSEHVITFLFKCYFFVVVRRSGEEHSCSAFWPCHPSFYVFLSLSLHQEAVKIILSLHHDLITLLFIRFLRYHCVRKWEIAVVFCFLTTSLFWVFVSLFVGEWRNMEEQLCFAFRPRHASFFMCFSFVVVWRNEEEHLYFSFQPRHNYFMCFFLCRCVKKMGNCNIVLHSNYIILLFIVGHNIFFSCN